MKKRTIYLLSFIIPVIIFAIIATITGRLPIFSGLYQISDSASQYPGFFIELTNQIKSGHLFYSFNGGLGINFLGVITYYLLSPLNLLLFFFNAKTLSFFYLLIIYIRIGLSGLTMSIYLNHQKKKESVWIIVFSIIFALMGFISVYFYNVMWIDSIIMLPLIMLGLDKLFKTGKPFLYIFSLTLGILFNYYIGYMLCVFSVIYFLYKLFNDDYKINKKIFIQFFYSSLLVGALSCIVIIPTYYALMNGKVDMFVFEWGKTQPVYNNALNIFYQMLPGVYKSNDWSYGPPTIYSTLFVYALVIFFFFNKSISYKEKIVAGLIIIFYYLSFAIDKLDYAWQLFQKPVGFQHRYSFTFSAFLILLAFKSLMELPKLNLKNKTKVIIYITFIILSTISFAFVLYINPNDVLKSAYFFLVVSILIFPVYLFIFYKKNYLIIIFIIIELIINTSNSLSLTRSIENYPSLHQKIVNNENAVNYIKSVDDSFYRMEMINRHISNDGMLYNYRGLNMFNSIYNTNLMNFINKQLGIKTSYARMELNEINPVFLSIFNFKYLIGKSDYFELIKENGNLSIYETKYPLSLGIMIPNDYKKIVFNNDKFKNLENIYSAFAGVEETMFEHISVTDTIIKLENLQPYPSYVIGGSTSGLSYARLNNQEPGYAHIEYKVSRDVLLMDFNEYENVYKVFINDESYDYNNNYFLSLKARDKITIIFKVDDEITLIDESFALLDITKYEELSKMIESNLLEVKTDSKHLIEGNVEVTNEKNILFLSIPYENQFEIKVDGIEVNYFAIFDNFIGIELPKGEHRITIDYTPKGLALGSIITLTATSLLIIYYYLDKRKRI